eukprot:Skav224402  [mRNA]  locus=scaffold2452:293195:297836:- [translate_table: standard]
MVPWRSLGALLALLVALWRGDALWNGGRSVPLLNFWRRRGFTAEQLETIDLTGKAAAPGGGGVGHRRLQRPGSRRLRRNATVLLGCRDVQRCALPGAQVLELDLADAGRWVMVNNAGVATQFPHNLTVDGVETTFQVNYLGHFLLTQRLLPLLQKGARVVHLSSGAHRAAPPEGVPLTLEGSRLVLLVLLGRVDWHAGAQASMMRKWDLMQLGDGIEESGRKVRYGMAKLANLLLAQEVDRWGRVGHRGVYSNAVHPGVVATDAGHRPKAPAEDMLRLPNFQAMLGPTLGSIAYHAAQLRNRFFAYDVEEAVLGAWDHRG